MSSVSQQIDNALRMTLPTQDNTSEDLLSLHRQRHVVWFHTDQRRETEKHNIHICVGQYQFNPLLESGCNVLLTEAK